MTTYDIEIEIYPDDDTLMALSPRGNYTYSIDSVQGADILQKIFGTNVKATVYTQDEEMTVEEWENTKGE